MDAMDPVGMRFAFFCGLGPRNVHLIYKIDCCICKPHTRYRKGGIFDASLTGRSLLTRMDFVNSTRQTAIGSRTVVSREELHLNRSASAKCILGIRRPLVIRVRALAARRHSQHWLLVSSVSWVPQKAASIFPFWRTHLLLILSTLKMLVVMVETKSNARGKKHVCERGLDGLPTYTTTLSHQQPTLFLTRVSP